MLAANPLNDVDHRDNREIPVYGSSATEQVGVLMGACGMKSFVSLDDRETRRSEIREQAAACDTVETLDIDD